jgi:enoyl-CoA hydratase/carnithine racemase
MPIIAAVEGPALAGGCALLSACDFVVVAEGALLGYPVHRIGVSPAVTTPTLLAAIGSGAARSLLFAGELLDAKRSVEIGLATRTAAAGEARRHARALAEALATKGHAAMRATKRWLNELDGTDRDDAFDRAAAVSVEVSEGEEARAMLAAFWSSRGGR